MVLRSMDFFSRDFPVQLKAFSRLFQLVSYIPLNNKLKLSLLHVGAQKHCDVLYSRQLLAQWNASPSDGWSWPSLLVTVTNRVAQPCHSFQSSPLICRLQRVSPINPPYLRTKLPEMFSKIVIN